MSDEYNATFDAAKLHRNVPPDWYAKSIKDNLFQRYWHTRRFEEVKRFIDKTEGSVLDVGCADGTFTKVILDKSGASKIIGIDVLKNSVNFAKKRYQKNKRMSFKFADAHSLPFESRSFNAVFCLEALEHVFDPLKVLNELYRVLKKGGYAVILVPSENWLFHSIVWPLWQLWPGKDIWEHTHLHNFSNGFLEDTARRANFKIAEDKKFLLGMLHLIKAVK